MESGEIGGVELAKEKTPQVGGALARFRFAKATT